MIIATHNCRGLRKLHLSNNNTQQPNHFFTWLRQTQADILALQELQLLTPPDINDQIRYNQFLNVNAAVWTEHCALLLRDPDLSLSNTDTALEGRVIITTVTSASTSFSATFCVMYAPSKKPDRRAFLLRCLTLPFFTHPPQHALLMGDLNFPNYGRRHHAQFQDWLAVHLVDCFTPMHAPPLPTFTHTGNGARTTIDYIFCTLPLHSQVSDPQQTCVPQYSDHDMLALTFTPALSPKIGRGSWRMNTKLLNSSRFLEELTEHLSRASGRRRSENAQQHWDRVKKKIKAFSITASIERKRDRQTIIQELNQRRQQALETLSTASPADKEGVETELVTLESEIQLYIAEEMDAHALRSGTLWREQGEANSGYFFRAIAKRYAKRLVPSLINPATDALTTTNEEKLQVAASFYSNLYTPDPHSAEDTRTLLQALPASATLSDLDREKIAGTIEMNQIKAVISHSPLSRAPGRDGIPFELYQAMLHVPWIMELLLEVMNDALQDGAFPKSWNETVMILLYKKGEASRLANWRPLSLINTDAKLFTKVLTLRLRPCMTSLTGDYQTGFTAGRHIADNGLALISLRDYCKDRSQGLVGIMLDQEKAYDRVHPGYLTAVLEHFQFPRAFVRCINLLFFSTEITLDINGHPSSKFTQSRGLRQGDPLSPLLFNLAFEPLLAYIQSSREIQGIGIPGRDTAVKLSAYADDLLIYLASVDEWHWLSEALHLYGRASNAKVNLTKTVAFPMSPVPNTALKTHLHSLQVQWHDHDNDHALIYLGFPVAFSKQQKKRYWDGLKTKIQGSLSALTTRSLSILGRGTLVNALALARLWHIVWVVRPTPDFITQLRKLIKDFMCPFKPQAGWSVITTPRSEGGLGVIDPLTQVQAFQLKQLTNMVSDQVSWGKEIVLDIMQWKTKSLYRLAPLLAPKECDLSKRMAGYPGIQRLIAAAACLPNKKDLIMNDQLPLSTTIMATPVEWWLPVTGGDRDITVNTRRMEEYFALDQSDPDYDRIISKPIVAKLQDEKAQLVHDLGANKRVLTDRYIRAASPPPKITRGDNISTIIRETDISGDHPEHCELQKATTKQLRSYLAAQELPALNPNSRVKAETGTRQQWQEFWSAKIPHHARTTWWRYKRDWLPCGSLRQHIWRHEPACQMEGCTAQDETKNHYIFQCGAKYRSWQGILQTYTTKLDWPDNDLNALLSFNRPKFDILPEYNISPAQLIACCLLGIARANTACFQENRTLSEDAITTTIQRALDRTIAQNDFLKPQ